MGPYATEYDLDQDERRDRSWLRAKDGAKDWVKPRVAAEPRLRTWSAAKATGASSVADDGGTVSVVEAGFCTEKQA